LQRLKPEIRINERWCKGCSICVEFCPEGVLRMEDERPVVANLEACSGCMLCEMICPDFAIIIERSVSEVPS
jgi:2-oxoglutarate ferredoxin oxidoreductase subunit delta